MEAADDGLDIESQIRQLLRDHKGVDIVLLLKYNDGESKQDRYFISHTSDRAVCRRLCHMAWESLKDPRPVQKAQDESEDEDE